MRDKRGEEKYLQRQVGKEQKKGKFEENKRGDKKENNDRKRRNLN